MAKISNTTAYPTKSSPAGSDLVIGTDVAGGNATKTFTLQSIANLYGGSGSGTVTSVGLSAGTTGLSITSDTVNPITANGTFTLDGTLVVANGGTGLVALGSRSQSLRVNAASDGLEYTDSNVVEVVKNNTSSQILKGDPLRVVGEVAGVVSVEVAQANSSSSMPCIGIAYENIEGTSSGLMIQVGVLKSINTNTISGTGSVSVGDVVYVAGARSPGELMLTRDKPIGVNLIQNIGVITKTGAQGSIQVTAIGRTNDLPNLAQGSIFLGDSNGASSALSIGTNTYVLTSNGTTASWAAATGGSSTISVQDSGSTPVTGISTLNFTGNLSVTSAPGIADISVSQDTIGISPFPIYQATHSVSTGSQTIIRQSVCESDVTFTKLEYFSIGASPNPISFAIYIGDITSSSSANLRASGTNATSVDGVNVITFSSPYSTSAGQNIVIVVSSQDTQSLAGSTALLSNTSISRGGSGYTSSFPSTLDGLTDGFASSVATGVCTHIY